MIFSRPSCAQEGREKITLSTFLRNVSATRFYQSLGYQVVDEEGPFLSLVLSLHSPEGGVG